MGLRFGGFAFFAALEESKQHLKNYYPKVAVRERRVLSKSGAILDRSMEPHFHSQIAVRGVGKAELAPFVGLVGFDLLGHILRVDHPYSLSHSPMYTYI